MFEACSAAQDDGYLVALLFNEKTQESTFAVYDASCLISMRLIAAIRQYGMNAAAAF